MSHDVIVIGGGAIGLSIARSLVRDRSVLLVERDVAGRQSSWAAAGMLSPHSEAEADNALLQLGLTSLELYRDFVAELEDETGIDVEYRADGVLLLASTEDEMEAIAKRADWQQRRGLDVQLLSPEQVRDLEPELTLDLRGALHCAGDHQVRPRRLIDALKRSCELRGVEIAEGAPADEILSTGGSVVGARVGGAVLNSKAIVVCAGAWASQIQGLRPRLEMSPRKGQVLALKMPGPVFKHLIRWKNLYFVPRNDFELVVGATNEDRGFERELTVAGLGGLLKGAQQMASVVGSYPVKDTWTGLRPLISDGLPAIGPAGVDGLVYALGHYRNGILLTPVTTELVDSFVAGRSVPDYVDAFSPMRFGQ
jgi:glycine oxidase